MFAARRCHVVLALFPLCRGLNLRQLSNATGEPVVIPLHNDEDMVMSASIRIGSGTDMKCVMDTGSFEQVVFSSKCEDCGEQTYNCDADAQCQWGQQESIQYYGSGGTESREAYTQVKATSATGGSSIALHKQMVWLVTKSELDHDMKDKLQCIFGLGPARSAVEFAKTDLKTLKENMLPDGSDAAMWAPVLKRMKKHIRFMEGVSLWQKSAQVGTMSFCLHPEFGEGGQLIFNDRYPFTHPQAFVDVPATGLYWQADMTHASITLSHKTISACGGGPKACSAILDTGTSLIGAPRTFVNELSNQLGDLMPKYGCEPDSLGRYPDFTFQLGAHTFTLPPRSYVCKFPSTDWDDLSEDDSDEEVFGSPIGGSLRMSRQIRQTVQERLPHLHAFKKAHDWYQLHAAPGSKRNNFFCAPCFFEYDRDGDSQQWLFGLPFFREYYSTFQTDAGYTSAKRMQFAKTSADCVPRKNTSKGDTDLQAQSGGVQHVQVDKLRFPDLQRRAGFEHVLMDKLRFFPLEES